MTQDLKQKKMKITEIVLNNDYDNPVVIASNIDVNNPNHLKLFNELFISQPSEE